VTVARTLLVALLVSASAAYAGTLRAGDEVPAFALPDGKGTPVSLDAARGKVVCIEFWASWCPVCRSFLPVLDDLARRFDGDLAVLAVNIDQQRSNADRFLAERLPAPALRVLYDPGGGLMSRFGASTMPAAYVVDRRGVVRRIEKSEDVATFRKELEGQLTGLLAEPAP